jgi:hypothetical protein
MCSTNFISRVVAARSFLKKLGQPFRMTQVAEKNGSVMRLGQGVSLNMSVGEWAVHPGSLSCNQVSIQLGFVDDTVRQAQPVWYAMSHCQIVKQWGQINYQGTIEQLEQASCHKLCILARQTCKNMAFCNKFSCNLE